MQGLRTVIGAPLKRPRATLLAVALVAITGLTASLLTGNRLAVFGYTDPGSQSARAAARLHAALGYDPLPGMVILASSGPGFDQSVPRAAGVRLAGRAARDRSVGYVQTPFGTRGFPVLLSRDRHEALLLIHFRSTRQDDVAAPIDRLRRGLHEAGLRLRLGGYAVGAADLNRLGREDLVRAELIAFPLLALLMLFIFRGGLAAAVPLVSGGVSVVGTFACLRLLSHLIGISIFALNLAVLLGLGLAVDYGLFLVSRFREEALEHGAGEAGIRRTMVTAGRAVAFSGAAVAGACACLLVFPQEFIYSMGIAGVFVALFSAAAALLVTPALLVLGGPRIARRRAARKDRRWPSRWYRWPRWVMRNRLDVAFVGVLALVAAAAPALNLRLTFPDETAIPQGVQSRSVADAILRDFQPYLEYPVNIAVERNHSVAGRPPATTVTPLLGLVPGVALATPVALPFRDTAFVQLVLRGPPLSSASQHVISVLRAARPDFIVGGPTAEFVDLKSSIAGHALLAIVLAALFVVVLLFRFTGSLVLPAKALLFHVLDLAAVFGLLTLVFQDDVLGAASLVAYHGPPAIETTVSVVIIASTFGLATDYSILLLSRVVEEHQAGSSDEQAVAVGIERTGPVITSSALLLTVALLALASSRVFLVKQLTVGQVLGVVIDVTCVRLLLLPAFMRVLGRYNWWAPRMLRRRPGARG